MFSTFKPVLLPIHSAWMLTKALLMESGSEQEWRGNGGVASDGHGDEADLLRAAAQPPRAPCGNDWLSIPGSLESDRKSSFQTVQKSGLLRGSPSLPPSPIGQSASSSPGPPGPSAHASFTGFVWLHSHHLVSNVSPTTSDACSPYFIFCSTGA